VQPTTLPAARRPIAPSRAAIWALLWGLLAVLHVTQAIWVSGGAANPGDLADGRFNQLVLEHGYQSLRGVYAWASPSQFYPVPNTLGLSDTHAGTLPIYAGLRFAGLPMDRAWQAWFVVVAALNALAAFRLFGALGVNGWVRGPLVFAGVSSSTMVWLTGTHMQMLPLFPALLGWAELVRWSDDRSRIRLVAASGWFAWQFAAGPYLAFFTGVITLAIGLARWLAGLALAPARVTPPAVAETRPVRAAVAALAVFVAGWGLAVAVAVVYARALRGGATQPAAMITAFAPDLPAWFTAAPVSVFYPAGWLGWHAGDLVEHAWFAGFLPWIMVLAALWGGWAMRRTGAGVWMLAIALGVFGVTLFFTRWSAAHPGAWVTVAGHFEVLRAFRGSGRVAGLLQVAMAAAAGLVLTNWRGGLGSRRQWMPVALAALVVIEGLSHGQPSTLVSVARSRSDAMIAAWRNAGDRPVLAFAFGFTNQPDVYLHLDAWSAALRLKRATLNGLTGALPGTHHRFIWGPTVENARRLMSDFQIPEESVSLVEGFGPAAEAALGITQLDQRPTTVLAGFDLQPCAWKLYAPLEFWPTDGVPMYQFTPDAELRFRLPDSVSRIEYLVGFRPDAYSGGGQTNGAGVTWLLAAPGGSEQRLSAELLEPFTRPEHRGLLRRSLEVPPGRDRVLIFRSDPGPSHSEPWDFLLLGRLRAK
jgi:hypothetical protein